MLTQKQESFARHYAETGDGKASALKAGYAESGAKVQASRLLKNPQIRERVNGFLTEANANHGATLSSISSELSKVFFHSLDVQSLLWSHKLRAGELLLRIIEHQNFEARLEKLEAYYYEKRIKNTD